MMTVCPGLASCGIVTCTEKVGPVAVAIGALSTEPSRSSTRPSAAKRLPVTVTTLPGGPDEGLNEMKACGVHAQAIAATPRPAVAMPTTDSQITRARRVTHHLLGWTHPAVNQSSLQKTMPPVRQRSVYGSLEVRRPRRRFRKSGTSRLGLWCGLAIALLLAAYVGVIVLSKP